MKQTLYDERSGRLHTYDPNKGTFSTDPIIYQDSGPVSHTPKQPAPGFYEMFDNFCRSIKDEANKTAKNPFVFDNSRLDNFTGIGLVQGISDNPNNPDINFGMYLVRGDKAGNADSKFSNADYRFELTSDLAITHFKAGTEKQLKADCVRRLLDIDAKV